MPPILTAREYQQLICPACGERKPPAQPLCGRCRNRENARNAVCPRCQGTKPPHYPLCADCRASEIMECPKCKGRKANPEHKLCPACHYEQKHGEKILCNCQCGCRNFKTRPRAPVCGICWLDGHAAP